MKETHRKLIALCYKNRLKLLLGAATFLAGKKGVFLLHLDTAVYTTNCGVLCWQVVAGSSQTTERGVKEAKHQLQ